MMSLLERFENKVMVITGLEDSCHLWTGALFDRGYGAVRDNGRTLGAHRVAYTLYNGPIPEGLHVMHSCDNRRCVNPNHLSVGTNLDNVRDRESRGRNGHKKKTHCPSGHEYSKENTYVSANGSRTCRICRAASFKAFLARKAAS